jgi:hypothetical protein
MAAKKLGNNPFGGIDSLIQNTQEVLAEQKISNAHEDIKDVKTANIHLSSSKDERRSKTQKTATPPKDGPNTMGSGPREMQEELYPTGRHEESKPRQRASERQGSALRQAPEKECDESHYVQDKYHVYHTYEIHDEIESEDVYDVSDVQDEDEDDLSAMSAEERSAQVRTQGKKGQKLPRINLAFQPEAFEYIRTMSGFDTISVTQYINRLIFEDMERRADTLAKLKALKRS